jgi:hypothetical protein
MFEQSLGILKSLSHCLPVVMRALFFGRRDNGLCGLPYVRVELRRIESRFRVPGDLPLYCSLGAFPAPRDIGWFLQFKGCISVVWEYSNDK